MTQNKLLNIEQLRNKRQLTVQEQNLLKKHSILRTALSFRANKEPWVNSVLQLKQLNPQQGILVECSSVICGEQVEFASAIWLSVNQVFYSMEAIITASPYELIELECFADITTKISISSHEKGIGKSFGALALEVLVELEAVN